MPRPMWWLCLLPLLLAGCFDKPDEPGTLRSQALCVLADGDVLVSGLAVYPPAIDATDVPPVTHPFLARLDSAGRVRWQTIYSDVTDQAPVRVVDAGDGTFNLCGLVHGYWFLRTNLSLAVLHVDGAGNLLGRQDMRITEHSGYGGEALAVGADGSLAMLAVLADSTALWGLAAGDGSGLTTQTLADVRLTAVHGLVAAEDGWLALVESRWVASLLRFDAAGTLVQQTPVAADTATSYLSLVRDPGGTLLIGGYWMDAVANNWDSDLTLESVSPSGEILWQRRYPTASLNSYGQQIRPLADGGALTLYQWYEPNPSTWGSGLARTAADGELLWMRLFKSGEDLTRAQDVLPAADGFLACGSEDDPASTRVVKLDAHGNTLWRCSLTD